MNNVADSSLERSLAIIRRRWPELEDGCDEQPVFILAAGWRSGSTLLQRMLMPGCFVWGEPYGRAGPVHALAEQMLCFTEAWPQPHFFYKGQPPERLTGRFIGNLYPSMADLQRAHQDFFRSLLAEPARRAGATRWGLKEVRLSIDHALYLDWLFPRARFLFLYRNPFDAWRSYAARRERGWRWYLRWPDEPLTIECFARHWRECVSGYLEGYKQVNGLLVRYEDLARGEFAALEEYLGFPVSREAAQVNPGDGGPPPLKSIPDHERAVLDRELSVVATRLGYAGFLTTETRRHGESRTK